MVSPRISLTLATSVSTSPRIVTVRRPSMRPIREKPRPISACATAESGTCSPVGRVTWKSSRSPRLSWSAPASWTSISKSSAPTWISDAVVPWKALRSWPPTLRASRPSWVAPSRRVSQTSGLPGRRSSLRSATPR